MGCEGEEMEMERQGEVYEGLLCLLAMRIHA